MPATATPSVLTSSPHCGDEGSVVRDQGVAGPWAQDATCPYAGHTCHASDMNYIVVAQDRIPWGHLNVIDLGVGGYRILEPGAQSTDLLRDRDRRPESRWTVAISTGPEP